MTWDDVVKNHGHMYDRPYVNCEDESERDFLIGIMTPLLPDYRAEVVEQALGYACRNLTHPRSTNDIINIVKTFVGKV